MTPSKANPPPPPPGGSPPPPPHHYYTPIPSQPHDQNYTVLPDYYSPKQRPKCNWHIICPVLLLVLAAMVYMFWPSDPLLKIERLHLTHLQIHSRPICIDITLNVTLKVQNVDVYSMDYHSLDVAVGYRGRKLGHVKSGHGHVMALGSSHVNAKIELECVKVFSDFVFFLEDLARGTVPFDTVTELTGHLGLFLFHFPFKTKVSCEVLVNTNDQTIVRQHCHPK
ncbi:hypothetical protein ACOSQ3_020848 [Xanthoceras sorbifolium]